jgi:hypothetical protein
VFHTGGGIEEFRKGREIGKGFDLEVREFIGIILVKEFHDDEKDIIGINVSCWRR